MIDRSNFEPLYLQVKNDIISKIESGEIQIGDKLMSENEMLQYYGVGRVTIRSALAELVSDGCVRKEQGLGSFCVAYPRKNMLNIDVLVDSTSIYFTPYMLRGISRVLERNTCNLLLHDTGNSSERIKQQLEVLLGKGSDGILLQPSTVDPCDEELVQLVDKFNTVGIPIVLVCGRTAGLTCASLSIDDNYGTCIAARYLLECGHRKILGLFNNAQHGTKIRKEGFLQTLSTVADAVPYLVESSENYGEEVLRLIREEGVTAIQCCNDLMAVECLCLLNENDICVPDDVSLIGYDNIEMSLSTVPQLTTVSHPKDHMGSDAAKTLLLHIQTGKQSSGSVIYRPELVIRQSVRQITP